MLPTKKKTSTFVIKTVDASPQTFQASIIIDLVKDLAIHVIGKYSEGVVFGTAKSQVLNCTDMEGIMVYRVVHTCTSHAVLSICSYCVGSLASVARLQGKVGRLQGWVDSNAATADHS